MMRGKGKWERVREDEKEGQVDELKNVQYVEIKRKEKKREFPPMRGIEPRPRR